MTPAAIRDKGLFLIGFLPLPHPHHAEGGMVFPRFHIEEITQQEERDLSGLTSISICPTTSCLSSRRRSF
jgi:cytochrome c peroxidase